MAHGNFIFGIKGKSLTSREKEFFEKSKPLGFILFSRNIESSEQLFSLTSSLKKIHPDVKIFTDQEGGRVQRIKFSKLYPPAGHFSNLYLSEREKAQEEVKKNYSLITKELKFYGIDSPCAPVCDIRFDTAHKVIGDRAFGDNAEQCIDLCKQAINGIIENNGIPIIKHIPGHGRALKDSHHALPIVDADLDTLENSDFKVFKELGRSEEIWGMTAHIIYSALDKKKPATISKIVIDYIKNNIGFKGKIMTDDIGMKALHDVKLKLADNLRNIVKESFDAGCDIVLHCSGNLKEMQVVHEAASL